MKIKRYIYGLISLFVISFLIGCGQTKSGEDASASDTETASEPTQGGTLNVAFAAEPESLDWMITGASATRDVGWHIFETLFALDNEYKVKPMLVDDYDISSDEKEYTIHLREGVNFHDGTTMSAEDVIASINRWRKVSTVGKITDEHIKSVKEKDDLTIVITLKEVYSSLLSDLAAPKSSLIITPASIAKGAGEEPLNPDQLIGTGPYTFDKWERGNEIILKKFAEYSQREEDWGGLTGKKEANIEEIKFQIVKDPQVMLNGLKTDLYDYAQSIPADLYSVLESNPDVTPVTYINGFTAITPDKSQAPFNDIKVRKALNHALDKKMIAEAVYGNEEFYGFDGALFDPKQKGLYSEQGTEDYLSFDKEKAKQLLESSSYDDEEITIMYANNYKDYEKISEIAKQQLEDVGFKVKLDAYEWATYLEKWGDSDNWDMVVVGWSTRFSPNELGMLSQDTSSSGWYKSDRWQGLTESWAIASTDDEKAEILAEMNETVYEELPIIKVSNVSKLDVKSTKLKNENDWVSLRFWNTWKNE